jgi:hypothetical protein
VLDYKKANVMISPHIYNRRDCQEGGNTLNEWKQESRGYYISSIITLILVNKKEALAMLGSSILLGAIYFD